MIDVNVEFERECGKCYGTSAWMPDKVCDACHSTGRIATKLGEALLEFLANQGIKPSIEPPPATPGRE